MYSLCRKCLTFLFLRRTAILLRRVCASAWHRCAQIRLPPGGWERKISSLEELPFSSNLVGAPRPHAPGDFLTIKSHQKSPGPPRAPKFFLRSLYLIWPMSVPNFILLSDLRFGGQRDFACRPLKGVHPSFFRLQTAMETTEQSYRYAPTFTQNEPTRNNLRKGWREEGSSVGQRQKSQCAAADIIERQQAAAAITNKTCGGT